ncbi:MAG TPA: ATP-binding cassette domain-containing protein [Acidobacteriota bacterium]|nr:ATP-binding cassette domain-containing protein [Acidobacteriota bacterium]
MIQFEHVSKIYPPAFHALNDISLNINRGEGVFLAGPSGAGKSTLLKLIFREEEPSTGRILIDGKNISRLTSRAVAALRCKIGLVFQEFRLLPGLSAVENVALAAEVVGVTKQASRTKAGNLLQELGLNDHYDAAPLALSAGERQRVAIARALINDPMLVLADEPTGNLDADAAHECLRLLFKIRDRGATVVVATHDLDLVNRYGTRVLWLRQGELIDDLHRSEARSVAR